MSEDQDIAVLLTCHGTVEHVRDIPDFVRKIRHGRPAPDDVVAEVTRRFEAIGGSPLMEISRKQASALEERLRVPVLLAGRLWGPSPLEVIQPLLARGVRRVLSLPLAPQSVHIYHRFVVDSLADTPLEVSCVPPYGLEEELVAAFANAILEARSALSESCKIATLLTAHSLPKRVIDAGDAYQREFEAMANAIRDVLTGRGMEAEQIHIAYQSQGMGGGDWLGPDVEAALSDTRRAGADAVVFAPVGFVAEHVETLYDIDVEAAGMAREMGFEEVVRMPAMNVRPDFIDALEAVARPLLRG